jgi:hypothetical protein
MCIRNSIRNGDVTGAAVERDACVLKMLKIRLAPQRPLNALLICKALEAIIIWVRALKFQLPRAARSST